MNRADKVMAICTILVGSALLVTFVGDNPDAVRELLKMLGVRRS